MPKYVNADTLADRLDTLAYDDWNQGTTVSWADAFKAFAEMVRNERVIDAVPAVRCKDCIHLSGKDGDRYCYLDGRGITEEDYCSKGERREDADS